ncbi:PH (Pleckstrin Homology) domain-containing protein [Jatrophihabitans sp. GAS493]|uniref:PH domain-containing protein n=1 Tax=Jatrophihabitans sp. GAS493 TaxID=1907575 RepID=UPI000BBFC579|nr:PH domain-containing protein [Jatrophihabitans sp. GAS493]SOD71170.1 PH (Pleckstrin Homology) domain-containing protein [Jatrophihabitans sp. GAS493]
MDIDRRPTCRYGPDRRLAWGAAVFAVLAVVAALTMTDPAGRLVAGLLAVVLGAYAFVGLKYSPCLVATSEGLRIHTLSVTTTLRWEEISSVRVDNATHLGIANRALELDFDERLVVLGRHALGTDPQEVCGVLRSFGAAPGKS